VTPARVVIAHNHVPPDADPSTADVLDQVALVEGALGELAIPFETVAVVHGRVWEALAAAPDTVVFNLLEAPPGAPQLQPASTAVLEILGMPFTGSPASVLWLTTDKLATRATLTAAGVPVSAGGRLWLEDASILDRVPGPWILKPAWEDASVGLEGQPVCFEREAALDRARQLAERFPDEPILAEHFLPGREFNVAVLAGEAGPEVLPVAEMEFIDFPPEIPPLVSYEAKWELGTFVDEHTQRRFPDPVAEADLVGKVASLARAAWEACGVSGYARVDIRLDGAGHPCVLEVNANPCLSAGAGFVVAARQAGLGPAEVVRRIIAAAWRPPAAGRCA